MKYLLAIIVAFSMSFSFADETSDKIYEAMQRNFDAFNKEDIEAAMDSCSIEMPQRELFRSESLKSFSQNDVHYSLLACDVLEVNFPYALVKVVQDTIVQNRDSSTTKFRNSTAIVPKDECVEYLQTLKFEDGVWKLLVIVSAMKPVARAEAN